jgi:FAD/FMN-containing dehydrogenase
VPSESDVLRASLPVKLREIVGESHLLTEPALMESYCVDWTGRFGGPALCVVRPGTVEEVSAVMRACTAAGVPVLPQGGNTGLVGGSVPAAGASSGEDGSANAAPVIISTRRLSWISEVDVLSGQISAGAGATLGDVQRAAQAAGWGYGVDLAARDSATIGGTVATNAGGIRVLAYGMTRAQVCGIEAVLPDGSVISHMSGLAKDNTGFDLAQLLCGSEGTLAIITAVRLRLHRPFGRSSIALVGCSDYDDVLTLTHSAASATLVGAEVIDATGMELVRAVADLPDPLAAPHPFYLLLEVADGGDGSGFVSRVLEDRDVVVGLDAREIERLWEYRERQAEAFGTLGVLHKLDVSVPLPALPACAGELRALLDADATVGGFGIFGHVADGNLHVEFVGPDANDESADIAILQCVAKYGGSISAEHGIGRLKAGHLGLSRSNAEVTAMRAIKGAWDPQGLMNPGVLFG